MSEVLSERSEEGRYQEQMARHHYPGALPKIGETAWYVATWREQWVAQLSLSAADGADEQKQTNEIGMVIPLLESCDIAGKDITGDALLTQRKLAG